MKIFDENGNLLGDSESYEPDLELGRVSYDTRAGKHYEAEPEIKEEYHYEVSRWYFEDGTSMDPTGNDDPHVKVIDDQTGKFEYVDCGEGKSYRGADITKVVDVEHVDAKDAYDETETVEIYTKYTQEELDKFAAQKAKDARQVAFMKNGPDQLDTNTVNIEDLTVMISEMAGIE